MLPTMSIGIVTVNLPLSGKAQNGALSQERGGEAAQGIEQGLSTEQSQQVISGDTSILSGNNLLCQNQLHSPVYSLLTGICNLGQLNPPSIVPTVKLSVNATVKDGQCSVAKSCTITITYGSKLIT